MTSKTASAPSKLRQFPLIGRPEFLSLILLILFVLLNVILQPNFFKLTILTSNLTNFYPLLLIAIGQAYIVLGGSIDLSLGAIVSLVNVLVMEVITSFGGGGEAIFIGMAAGILAGFLCGAINGLLIAIFRLQAIVTTFASSIVIGGLALRILPEAGGELPAIYYEIYGGRIIGIPFILFCVAVLLIVIFLIGRSKFFAHLLALGGNPAAAYQSGLSIFWLRVTSHALGGLFAALAALAILGVAGAGDPLMGQAFTLTSVCAVVLGGVALAGGWGSAWGAILGAIILGLINNLIFFANINYVYQNIVQGAIILIALTGGIYTSRRPQ